MLNDASLIEEGYKRGFGNAATIKPAHINHNTDCPVVTIPADATIEVDGHGNLLFKVGKFIDSFEQVDRVSIKWVGMIYYKRKGSWADIVTHRVGETEWKSKSISNKLDAFPSEGVCWQPTKELRDYLLARDKSSTTACGFHVKGIAWNYNSCWEVATYSSKTEYNIKQLEPFIQAAMVRQTPPPHIGQNPMTPDECYIPEKWCIKCDSGGPITKAVKDYANSKGLNKQCLMFNGTGHKYYCITSDGYFDNYREVPIGYIEITFDHFMKHIYSTLEPEPVPFSVRNNYRLPDKWSIFITSENISIVTDFLRNKKDEYAGYKDTWSPCIGNSLLYPQHTERCYGTAGRCSQPGYTEITTDQFIKHVLTHTEKNQFTNNLNLKEDGKSTEFRGSSETNKGESCKVQRPHLSVTGRDPVRGAGIKCTSVKIQVGSGYLPN